MSNEDKERIRTNLTPYMHRLRDNAEWREAFLMYNAVHGTQLKPDCPRCFRVVREWLER